MLFVLFLPGISSQTIAEVQAKIVKVTPQQVKADMDAGKSFPLFTTGKVNSPCLSLRKEAGIALQSEKGHWGNRAFSCIK